MTERTSRPTSVIAVPFLTLFTAQAGAIVLSPVLPRAAGRDTDY
jgi:hypothetical protein